MHKTINVLNCSPKSAQAKVKGSLHDIWQTESKAVAEKAYELCIKMYVPKYPKAAICLQKDRDGMLHMMFKLGQCAGKMETIVGIRLLDQGDNWGKVQRWS